LSGERQAFLIPLVPPWAAYILARDFGKAIERKAAELRPAQPHVADQLLLALAQLRKAGQERWEAHEQAQRGSGEVPHTAPGAASVTVHGGPGLTTRQVAEKLEVGVRQVRNLQAPNGPLSATLVKGRLLFDEVSVAIEQERRSKAS
jgi:hypothetical protein